jgi:hypothetical protein
VAGCESCVCSMAHPYVLRSLGYRHIFDSATSVPCSDDDETHLDSSHNSCDRATLVLWPLAHRYSIATEIGFP